MNIIEKYKKLILKLSITSLIIIIAVFTGISYANNEVETLVGGSSQVVINGTTVTIPTEIHKAYSYRSSSHKPITQFPVDGNIFNSSKDYFCVQHGTAYASLSKRTKLGMEYHNHLPIAVHMLDKKYTTDPTGDVPFKKTEHYFNNLFNWIKSHFVVYIDENGETQDKFPKYYLSNFFGYRDDAKEAEATSYAYTNFWYSDGTHDSFDCEGDTAPTISNGSKTFSEGGLAFLLACYKSSDGTRANVGYTSDPLQRAIWAWRNEYSQGNHLVAMAKNYDEYHKASKEPNLCVMPEEGVGSSLNGSVVEVGPFSMSDYIDANNYKVQGTFNMNGQSTTTPIDPNDDDLPVLEEIPPVYEKSTLQEKFGDSHYGGVIEIYAVLTNENGQKSSPILVKSREKDDIPLPGETNFSIQIPESYLSTYDELEEIICRYQRVHACGSLTDYDGKQHIIVVKEKRGSAEDTYKSFNESVIYSCSMCANNNVSFASRSDAGKTHTYKCHPTYVNYCQHGYEDGYHPNQGAKHRFCAYKNESGHPHTESCYSLSCGKTVHTHTNECYDTFGSQGELICGKEAHEHSPWLNNSYRGCYGNRDCSYSNKSYHPHDKVCRNCEINGAGKTEYCIHGHKNGDHGNTCLKGGNFITSHYHDDCPGITYCYHPTGDNATPGSDFHGHTTCFKFDWEPNNYTTTDIAQNAISASGVLVNEQIDYKIKVKVPLITDLSIYKYISKVTHVGNGEVNDLGETRRNLEKEAKIADPVKVEVGDLVTYTIEIFNNERFPLIAGVEDLIPADCEFVSITSDITTTIGGQTVNLGELIKISNNNQNVVAGIPLEGNSSTKINLEVIPLNQSAINTLYTNVAKITTNNDTDPPLQTGKWGSGGTFGEREGGSIINGNPKLEDEDSYILKMYNVSANKYIYDVNHNKADYIASKTDTSFQESETRKEMTEDAKKANPVYVEYGDIVKYKIVLDNTSQGYADAPYYSPADVYVDILDKLPKKYSNLNVVVEDGDNSYTITDTNGELTIEALMVPAGATRTVEVSLIVEEHTKGTLEENNVIIKKVRNINRGSGKGIVPEDKYNLVYDNTLQLLFNNSNRLETKDYYILNDYNVVVDKYLYKYDEKVTKENNNLEFSSEPGVTNDDGTLKVSRKDKSEDFKKNNPLSVEKGEKINYVINVNNKAVTQGNKYGTQVRPVVYEKIEKGLNPINIKGEIYQGNTKVFDAGVSITKVDEINEDGRDLSVYEITLNKEMILDPGQELRIDVEVEIVQSNMYLFDLRNSGLLGKLENINIGTETDPNADIPREVRNDNYDENIAEDADKESFDYVRMKDLVISGEVWLDINRDGYMNDSARSDSEINNFNINSNAMKSGVKVNLHLKGNDTPIRTTITDENGLYTFGKNEALAWNTEQYTYTDGGNTYSSDAKYQRIDKASGKDGNGNYTAGSKYNEYYIEYEYDGVVYKSTIYSGKENINDDGSYNSNYLIDSNASELLEERENFNKKHEYISYNVSYGLNTNMSTHPVAGDSSELEFEKTEYTSQLIENPARIMKARSFIDKEGGSQTDYIWLFNNSGNTAGVEIPETDYLKYINLGLMLREDVDLTLSKDVYKVKTTVNGEEMEYEFNQNSGINGEGQLHNDYIIDKAYEFEVYESDYKYRIEQYISDAVKNYKGRESELNIEIIYKINIYNRAVKDDVLIPDSTDTKLDAKIHEIIDLYDENFIKYKDNPDESVTVKTKDDNGFLSDKQIKIAQAWYGNEDPDLGTQLNLSNTSKFLKQDGNSIKDNDFTSDGYNTLYITGMDDVVIKEDEGFDIYVKYVIDKENSSIINANTGATENIERALKIAERTAKENGRNLESISQINAYSIWYENGKPASIVDYDSNAGNIGLDNDGNKVSADNIEYYEDITYKTGINIIACRTENSGDLAPDTMSNIIRKLDGRIWDDSRSVKQETNGTAEYFANGIYDENDLIEDENVKLNENVDINYDNQFVRDGQGGNTVNLEKKDIAVRSAKAEYIEVVKMPINGEIRYYEEILQNPTWPNEQAQRSNEQGQYELKGFIPGNYVVRYTYGDSVEKDIANYDENDITQKDMLVFNGQDYKSTKYNEAILNATDMDSIIEALEEPNLSDAMDDEIRRLQVNSYSEVMTSENAEVLKGLANGTVPIIEARTEKNTKEQLKLLTDKTYMNAETVEFLVRPERIENQIYTKLKSINKNMIDFKDRDFKIKNIDFGLEYRPESGLSLTKEIDEIKIITENGETLIDLFFYTERTDDPTRPIVHYIDKEKSKGNELTQFISNNYEYLRSGLTTEELQGFVYIQVDMDLLQGSTIEIIYKLVLLNDSEIDRISKNLNEIRYKENDVTKNKITEYMNRVVVDVNKPYAKNAPEGVNDQNTILNPSYTASGTAGNILIADLYARDDIDGTIYRKNTKDFGTYFGKYVGKSYHTRNTAEPDDVIAELKFDKIIDYVDTNMVYVANSRTSELIDKRWDFMSGDLDENAMVGENAYDLRTYIKKLRKKDEFGNYVYSKLLNPDGKIYSVAISVDDRISDQQNEENIINKSLSKFLMPESATDDKEKTTGIIYLPVSKIVSAESDTKEMIYENIAEIIQFTTLTGRRSNFDTTIGNADFEDEAFARNGGSTEFKTSSLEADSGATEVITLTPPTGLDRTRRNIVETIDTLKDGSKIALIPIAVIIIAIIVINVIIGLKKGRKIK